MSSPLSVLNLRRDLSSQHTPVWLRNGAFLAVYEKQPNRLIDSEIRERFCYIFGYTGAILYAINSLKNRDL